MNDSEKTDAVEEKLRAVKQVLEDKKACDLNVVDVRGKTSLADYLLICHATSETHSSTLAEAVRRAGREIGLKVLGSDVSGDSEWKVLDYGDIIVHIFLEKSRRYYDLDGIWSSEDPAVALEDRGDLRRERKSLDVRSIFVRAMSRRRKPR